MDGYRLSNEGFARLRRMRTDTDMPASNVEGYEILNYLYENSSGTLEEIIHHTGLPRNEVYNILSTLMSHGYVEGSA